MNCREEKLATPRARGFQDANISAYLLDVGGFARHGGRFNCVVVGISICTAFGRVFTLNRIVWVEFGQNSGSHVRRLLTAGVLHRGLTALALVDGPISRRSSACGPAPPKMHLAYRVRERHRVFSHTNPSPNRGVNRKYGFDPGMTHLDCQAQKANMWTASFAVSRPPALPVEEAHHRVLGWPVPLRNFLDKAAVRGLAKDAATEGSGERGVC